MAVSCSNNLGFRALVALTTLLVVAVLGVGIKHDHDLPAWDDASAPFATISLSDGDTLTCWSCALAHSPLSQTIARTGSVSAEPAGIRLVSILPIVQEWRSRSHASRGPPDLV